MRANAITGLSSPRPFSSHRPAAARPVSLGFRYFWAAACRCSVTACLPAEALAKAGRAIPSALIRLVPVNRGSFQRPARSALLTCESARTFLNQRRMRVDAASARTSPSLSGGVMKTRDRDGFRRARVSRYASVPPAAAPTIADVQTFRSLLIASSYAVSPAHRPMPKPAPAPTLVHKAVRFPADGAGCACAELARADHKRKTTASLRCRMACTSLHMGTA